MSVDVGVPTRARPLIGSFSFYRPEEREVLLFPYWGIFLPQELFS
jgi:hypothetical protein